MDPVEAKPTAAVVGCEPGNPSGSLLCGWLASRLGISAELEETGGPGITSARLETGDGHRIEIARPDGRSATLTKDDEPGRQLPLPRRQLGDLLAEELRRMDPDFVYGEALEQVTGLDGLNDRPGERKHVWRDPAQATA
jgi:glucose-6-phosphate dehydrogenase assembly protein OpcA